jgi:hypothetical protein
VGVESGQVEQREPVAPGEHRAVLVGHLAQRQVPVGDAEAAVLQDARAGQRHRLPVEVALHGVGGELRCAVGDVGQPRGRPVVEQRVERGARLHAEDAAVDVPGGGDDARRRAPAVVGQPALGHRHEDGLGVVERAEQRVERADDPHLGAEDHDRALGLAGDVAQQRRQQHPVAERHRRRGDQRPPAVVAVEALEREHRRALDARRVAGAHVQGGERRLPVLLGERAGQNAGLAEPGAVVDRDGVKGSRHLGGGRRYTL